MSSHPPSRVLLPPSLRPSIYHLHLVPDLVHFTFRGTESVDVQVLEETHSVTIHALDIQVQSAAFEDAHKTTHNARNITYDASLETVTFEFEHSLKLGHGVLKVEFTGELNNKMMGFYRSKYFVNGEERYAATTQMEPTGARRAFPCWDEPAIKAKFFISLTVAEHLTTLSNMDPISQTSENGLKTVHFGETPVMSTYLVAFVVGEFDHVEGSTKEGTRIRVYTPLGKKEQGVFSRDVAIRCLSYYNDYYGIPYPLPKLDMIAIPDFAAGAMENWGLVTYREIALLIDEQNSGVRTKQRVAYVVAHELAHQWFGNLVTMEWWKELWLNEGFATFVGNQAISHLFPEWDIWTQFIKDYVNRALELDALESSHPIEVEVYSSAEIEEIFDQISYSKGASVIRMLSNLLGEEKFRKGLNIYLNRHKYSNAVTEDLWKALGEASNFNVAEFMNKYTKVTGYPLVSVHSTHEKNVFNVQQTRFLADGRTAAQSPEWWISLGVRTSKSSEIKRFDVKSAQDTVTIDNGDAEWLHFNAELSGFYRLKYSSDIISKLTVALEKLALPTVDRIGIQNDAFALAQAGLLDTTDALNIAKAYLNEVDYTVWSDLIANNLRKVKEVWSAEPNYDQLKKFIRHLITPISQKLGWDPKPGESDLTGLLRNVILDELSNVDDPHTAAEAKKRFENFVQHNVSIPADTRTLVYKQVAKESVEGYEKILNIYRTADLHEEKLRALRAITANHHPDVLKRTLEFSLSSEVREQDIMYIFFETQGSGFSRDAAWNFMKANWSQFQEKLGKTGMLMDRIIKYGTEAFVSNEKADDVEHFFKEHPVPVAERTIKQSVEAIRTKAKWLERNRSSVAHWLQQQ